MNTSLNNTCYYCKSPLELDGKLWLDETLSDTCIGDDYGMNENGKHWVIKEGVTQ